MKYSPGSVVSNRYATGCVVAEGMASIWQSDESTVGVTQPSCIFCHMLVPEGREPSGTPFQAPFAMRSHSPVPGYSPPDDS